MFNNIKDATDYIFNTKRFTKRQNLNDMYDALNLMNNPQNDYKIIHIGGTNGKGSVSKTLSKILEYKSQKVGLYVSPFVVKVNERIQINSEYISDEDLLEGINFIYDFNIEFSKTHENLGFFEQMTLIAFRYFSLKKCDIVVLEVGLGGRLDATNVCKPIISAVTNIQKDHTEQLGKTYKKILKEKLGIMKDNIPFITSIKKPELIPIIKEYSIKHNSPLYFVRNVRNIKLSVDGTSFTYKGNKYRTKLIGIHQAYNASLVLEIINVLNEKYYYSITKEDVNKGFNEVMWPGRFEIFDNHIILDGAHNKEGIIALKDTIQSFTDKKITICFTAMKDKDSKHMIEALDSIASRIYFTEIDYKRSDNAYALYELSNNKNKYYEKDYHKLFNEVINDKSNEFIVFCGSLYFISRIRSLLTDK